MNYSKYRVSLDMHDTSSQVMLNVKQGDSARKIYISLTDGGRPYKITEDCTARLRARTSLGTILFNDCDIKDNVIEYTLTNETCKNVGIVECEVTLYGADSIEITSARFSLIVEGVITSADEIESTNEFTALTNALVGANNLNASVSKVGDTTTISVTKKDGTTEAATVKDGANGKDGYTPIKGVDYFDGAAGKDGKDGKDANTNLFANALKSKASGKVIRIDDVSPIEHAVKAKVRIKNLLNADGMANASFVKNDDGSFTFTKSSSSRFSTLADISIPANTYFSLSVTNIEGTAESFAFQFKCKDGSYPTAGPFSPANLNFYMKTASEVEGVRVFFDSSVEDGVYLNISGLQIELGGATEYVPYVDVSTVTLTRCGKNLICYPYSTSTKTINGIAFTVNDDGSVTANGTAKETAIFDLQTIDESAVLKNGITYTLSGAPSGSSYQTYNIEMTNNKAWVADLGSGRSIVGTGEGYRIYIAILKGVTVNNVTFYPQLEVGSEKTDYELLKEDINYIPNADGTLEFLSLSPTMTLFTDAEGAIIELEYNKDINTRSNMRLLGEVEITEAVAEVVFDGFEVDDIYVYTKGLKTDKSSSCGCYLWLNDSKVAALTTAMYTANVFNAITTQEGFALVSEIGGGYKYRISTPKPDLELNAKEIKIFGSPCEQVGKITKVTLVSSEASTYPFTNGLIRLFGR